MRFMKFRFWLSNVQKKTWIFVGIIAGFVALAIAALIVWMHLCGYTIASWLSKFWPTLTIIGSLALAGLLAFILFKLRKRRF